MDHLLVHTLRVLRRTPIGSEDGTPTMGDFEPVSWDNGMDFGPCRLDSPRDVSVTKPDGSIVIVQRSTVLCGLGCPARELDRLEVTTDRGTQVWFPGGIADAGGMHGAHHLEINVSREVHR